jgi:Mlc titration factor MtfA (ptsG expression regulator)
LNGEFESDQSDVTPQPDDVGRVDSVLREYAWTNRAEFFAVATESFFCTPGRLRAGKPALYQALRDFYRQDPAGERLSRFTGEGRSQDGRSVSA